MEVKNLDKWKDIETQELIFINILFVIFTIFVLINCNGFRIQIGTCIIMGLIYMCARTTINNQYEIAKQINQIQELSIEMIDSNRVYVRCEMKNGTTKYLKLKCQYAKNQEPYVDAIGSIVVLPRNIDIFDVEGANYGLQKCKKM